MTKFCFPASQEKCCHKKEILHHRGYSFRKVLQTQWVNNRHLPSLPQPLYYRHCPKWVVGVVMWNWDLLVVIRKCDRPVPSKSRSPLLPRPLPALVCSAFMSPMFYSPFLSAHIGLVIFHPADWLLVTLLRRSALTAPRPLWLYGIITSLSPPSIPVALWWDVSTPSSKQTQRP